MYKIHKDSEMHNVPKSSMARLVLKSIKPEAKTGAQLMLPNQAKNNQSIEDRKIGTKMTLPNQAKHK